MLINTIKLDKNKTYQVNEVGTSTIAKILQTIQHKKYSNFEKSKIASHSFILRNKNEIWYVWENHLKWNGIREYTLKEYEKDNEKSSIKKVIINEFSFNVDAMDYWKNNNPGYSVLDLGKITSNRLLGLKLLNMPGMVCSEAIANCGFKICNILKLKSEYITPIDWQFYFLNC